MDQQGLAQWYGRKVVISVPSSRGTTSAVILLNADILGILVNNQDRKMFFPWRVVDYIEEYKDPMTTITQAIHNGPVL